MAAKLKLSLALLLLLCSEIATAAGTERIIRQRETPSNELPDAPGVLAQDETFRWACYTNNGAFLVPCSFRFELLGLAGPEVVVTQNCAPDSNGLIPPDTCGNGGHPHPDRPVILGPPNGTGKVSYPGDTATQPVAEDLIVEGLTGVNPNDINTLSVVRWDVSQAAGIYTWKSEVRASGGRYFLEPDVFQDGTLRALGKLDVRSPGNLRQIPAPGPDDKYSLDRNPNTDSIHTDAVAFAGTEDTIEALQLIGELVFFQSSQNLSINDMSLPKGGVFDYRFNWTKPHRSHRNGRDTDINRSIDCYDPATQIYDTVLLLAVDAVLTKTQRDNQVPSALFCEDTGNAHIDTTNLIP